MFRLNEMYRFASNIIWPPLLPPSGPMSINPIRLTDDVKVILDNDNCIALVHVPVHNLPQPQ